MDPSKKYTSIHYHSYLELDKVLSAQVPRSGQFEKKAAHDETLFIIMHQVYELWFKQILHEVDSILEMFQDGILEEEELNTAVLRLKRISEILELVIKQIFVMETLTPLDFMDFRNYLFPASGFQSFQFRLIETTLGLRDEDRLTYNGHSYKIVFAEEQKKALTQRESARSLFEVMETWLERIPFLKLGSFDFIASYKKAVENMLAREESAINATEYLSPKMKEMRINMLGKTSTYFSHVLSQEAHEKMQKEGKVRLSYRATQAALFINLYRDCLLYTSPSPRDATLSRMPSSA